jgi:hypothetical protein
MNPLLAKNVSRTLHVNRLHLTKAHAARIEQGENEGDSSCFIEVPGHEDLWFNFPSMEFGGVWLFTPTPEAHAAALAGGWHDLASLIALALANKIDWLEFNDTADLLPEELGIAVHDHEA